MPEPDNKTTRAEFLRYGAMGLGLIALLPVVGTGCTKPPEYTDNTDADMKDVSKVEPSQVGYEPLRGFNTKLHPTRGIACADDKIAVVGSTRVLFFRNDAKPLGFVEVGGEPRAVALAEDSTAYVGLTDHIVVVKTGGQPEHWPTLGERARITCVSLGKDELLVADAGNRVVLRYDLTGKLLSKIGEKEPGKQYTGLAIPSLHLDAVFGLDDDVYVSNPGQHRVERHKKEGGLISFWGKGSSELADFCGCCNPTDIALLPNGDFVTSEKGVPRVKLYGPDGTFKCVVAKPDDFPKNAAGIDIAVSGSTISVIDPISNTVRQYVPTGGNA